MSDELIMDLISFLNKHKIAATLGTFGLSFITVFGVRDLIQHDKITYNLIGKALYKAAEDDGILSTEEKAKFLKDLGLKYSVQNKQELLLKKNGEFVDFYLNSSYINTIHRGALNKYIGESYSRYWSEFKQLNNFEKD